MSKPAIRILLVFWVLFFAAQAFADFVLPSPQNAFLPPPPNSRFLYSDSYRIFYWPARISGWGLAGNSALGMGDLMLPLIGNDQLMFYTDAQGKYSDSNDWFGGLGIGLRGINDAARIFGGYVFADKSEFVNPDSLRNSSFWFISPGVESLGNLWDFRINGYIPVSSQTHTVGTTFANNLGINEFVVFRFHQEYDRLLNINNVVGPGADAEIGREIPWITTNTRLYVGGYVFAPKDSTTVGGGIIQINCPLSHYVALTASDSYDNVFHNQFAGGIKFTLGGIPDDVVKENRDISRRMVDPITRNLATISSGAAIPVDRINKNEGGLRLVRDNIYFFTTTDGMAFNAALGTQNCTFEHPCQASDFSQTTIDSLNVIAPGTNFFLDPGIYNFSATGVGLTINNGQSIFGRIAGYTLPASGADRPVLAAGTTFTALTLLGNNTIDSIQLTTGGSAGDFALVGIALTNATNVLISNSQIGFPTSPGDFVTALGLAGSSQATVVNSTLSAVLPFFGLSTVSVSNDSQLTIQNSTVLASNTFDTSSAIGVSVLNDGQVSIIDSNISATNTIPGGTAIGVQTNQNSHAFISGSTVSANATLADALQQNDASTITTVNSRCFENGTEVPCTP